MRYRVLIATPGKSTEHYITAATPAAAKRTANALTRRQVRAERPDMHLPASTTIEIAARP
jgi:hypothetical protein